MSFAPSISVEGLSKSFGAQRVLREVTFFVPKGETYCIIGGSGQGKSVLLKHVMRLLLPDSGTVRVDGEAIESLSGKDLARVRKKMGMVFQESALFDSMTCLENVAFGLMMHRKDLSKREILDVAREKLRLVGLPRTVEEKPGCEKVVNHKDAHRSAHYGKSHSPSHAGGSSGGRKAGSEENGDGFSGVRTFRFHDMS